MEELSRVRQIYKKQKKSNPFQLSTAHQLLCTQQRTDGNCHIQCYPVALLANILSSLGFTRSLCRPQHSLEPNVTKELNSRGECLLLTSKSPGKTGQLGIRTKILHLLALYLAQFKMINGYLRSIIPAAIVPPVSAWPNNLQLLPQ